MTPLSPLADLLDLQQGVVARRQVLDLAGESDATIRRRLRRRDWVTVHPGVYVNHTGPLTWLQRAWAAVLYAAPAVLAGESAIRAGDGPGRRDRADGEPIHVAIAADRTVEDQPGIAIHRMVWFEQSAQRNLSPPRVRIEQAVIDVAACASSDLQAIATLSDAVRSRRTTPDRLLAVVTVRRRLARRALIVGVLDDAASGTASVLEVEYLRRVERAHGLPRAERQVREVTSGVVYRDAEIKDLRLVIELDGRLGHSSTSERDADLERDLDVAATDRGTIRLGWGQVHVRPCATAAKLAIVLARRGWQGQLQSCPLCPPDSGAMALEQGRQAAPDDDRQAAARQAVDFLSAGDEKSTA